MFDLYKLELAEIDIKKHFPVPVMYNQILGLYGDLEKGSLCCPFHGENTPSFSYAPHVGDGIWRCFGACNTGGDTIELYRFYIKHKENRHISRAVAIQQLLQHPKVAQYVRVGDLKAEPLKHESFEKMLLHEHRTQHRKMEDDYRAIKHALYDISKEQNQKNFIKKYDSLLKFNWKGGS